MYTRYESTETTVPVPTVPYGSTYVRTRSPIGLQRLTYVLHVQYLRTMPTYSTAPAGTGTYVYLCVFERRQIEAAFSAAVFRRSGARGPATVHAPRIEKVPDRTKKEKT